MKHTLEVRTTISATPAFFRRIHYMAASLAALNDSLSNHEIVVSIGSSKPRENLYRTQPWSNNYPIIWRWIDSQAYAEYGYRATNRDRALHMARGDYVMMVDADVLFIHDFYDLIRSIEELPVICGVMAHISPFRVAPELICKSDSTARPLDDSDYWNLLAKHFGIAELPLEYELSGWGAMEQREQFRYAPAYFNGGMVVGPVDLMDEMCRLFGAAEEAVDHVMQPGFFRPQVARTLAIYKAGLPHRVLPVRYHYPNDPSFDKRYPDELSDVRIMHYLRTNIVHRDNDFASNENVERLIGRSDLSGSNETFRRRVEELYPRVKAEAPTE